MKHVNITFLLIMLLNMVSLKSLAYDLAIENEDGVIIYYNYVDGGLEVTYKAITSQPRIHYFGIVAIPDFVEVAPGVKKAVVSIGSNAFEWCTALTSVTIPNTVTTIKSFAFAECENLRDLAIYCGGVHFHDSGTGSGDINSFKSCKKLTNVYISDLQKWCSITYDKIESSPLYYAKHLFLNGKEITDLVIPENVTSISDFAFYGCESIKTLTLTNGVTSIGEQAFYGCTGLTSLVIPANVTNISANAFASSLLKNVVVKSSTPPLLKGSAFNTPTANHGTLFVPNGTWDAYAFDNVWCKFINIKELTTTKDDLSSKKVYTLLNTSNYDYTVYDSVNDGLRTDVHVNGLDENNPDHCWQTVEVNGQTYLYNLGAKKFAIPSERGDGLILTNEVSSINMDNNENGVIIAGTRELSLGFVENENIAAINDLDDIINYTDAIEDIVADDRTFEIYTLDGRKLNDMPITKGVYIINGKRVMIK